MTRGVIIFWVVFAILVGLDYAAVGHPRVEPGPFALGSGQASSSGHCSGR
jgi:hypothetical protein